MRKTAVDFCPVPYEQQPVNEYEQLKESWLCCWAVLDLGDYITKIAWIGFWGFLISALIASASYSPGEFPLKFTLCSLLGDSFLVALVVLKIYLGWVYVGDRLEKDRIFYEESGWYDGQTWLKPTAMLNRDRLIVSYQIQPILSRLQKTFLFLAGLGSLSCLTWLFFG